jgi:hypothetical protein
MLFEHIPLIVGVGLVVAVHTAGEHLTLDKTHMWTAVIDAFLLVSQVVLFVSLVAAKALELVVELTVAAVSGWRRIREAASTEPKRLNPEPQND